MDHRRAVKGGQVNKPNWNSLDIIELVFIVFVVNNLMNVSITQTHYVNLFFITYDGQKSFENNSIIHVSSVTGEMLDNIKIKFLFQG